ncbi:MAG: FUSC family protein [Acidimicrobiales bacterium]
MAGSGAAAAPEGWWQRLRPKDPGHHLLRRALRVAVVMPLMVVLGDLVLGESGFTLFGAFGAFALLASVNLGGRAPGSRHAFLAVVAVGAVLIPIGSAASDQVVAAVLVMLVAVFAIELVMVFGGYVSAAGPALLLPLVVAIMVPIAPGSDIGWREAGWLTAGVAGYLVTRWWWPSDTQRPVSLELAGVCRGIARAVRDATARSADGAPHDAVDVAALVDQLRDARARYLRDPNRPAGPSRHDRALVMLFEELGRSLQALAVWTPGPITADAAELRTAHDQLCTSVADGFDAAAATSLERDEADEDCLVTLDARRDEHLTTLEAELRRARLDGEEPETILTTIDEAFPLRVLSFAALTVVANAAVAAGAEVDTSSLRVVPRVPRAGLRSAVAGSWAILRSHLRPDAVWFRNSLRAAVALALAAAVAQLLELDNAYWVVLGTVSVLRSNVVSTGRTAVQSISGNALGVAVTLVLIGLSGGATWVQWVVMVAAIFLAAYTPVAVSYVVGQASFAVMVVVLFTLLRPGAEGGGWIRLVDVAIGVSVSVVVALVFWPRGAALTLRRSVASFLHADATAIDQVTHELLEPAGAGAVAGADDAVAEPRRAVGDVTEGLEAQRRETDEAFRQYLTERGAKRVGVGQWAALVGLAAALLLAADALQRQTRGRLRVVASDGSADAVVLGAWSARVRAIDELATQMTEAPGAVPSVPDDRPRIDAALREQLARPAVGDDAGVGTLALILVAEWLLVIDRLLADARPAAAAVQAATARPWWR